MPNVLLDKLAFVVPASNSVKYQVSERIKNFILIASAYYPSWNLELTNRVFDDNNSFGDYYNNNHQIIISRYGKDNIKESFSLLLSYFPKYKHQRFLRAEFTPTKSRRWGAMIVSDLIHYLLQENERCSIFGSGFITTMHICINNRHCNNDSYIYAPNFEDSEIWRDQNNYVETFSVGQSSRLFIKYDKYIEQMAKGISARNTWTRLEAQIKHQNIGFSQVDYNYLENTILLPTMFDEGFLKDTRIASDFRITAYESGINSALQEIEGHGNRKIILRRLRSKHLSNDFNYRAQDLCWDHVQRAINFFK